MVGAQQKGGVAAQRHARAGNAQFGHGLETLFAHDDNFRMVARELLLGLGVVALRVECEHRGDVEAGLDEGERQRERPERGAGVHHDGQLTHGRQGAFGRCDGAGACPAQQVLGRIEAQGCGERAA